MTSTDPLPDEQARQAVVDELNSTLFLEAGAGSGKTSCLVSRFVALVESGVAADHIAAITFTEKAAAELVDRIRAKLQRRAEHNARCRDALLVLDSAAIGTLHSFAQRILTEHPIEAGLPPRFSVHDEIASQIEFDEQWDNYVDQLFANPQFQAPLLLWFASGAKIGHLRDVAVAFNANWDLVAERAGVTPPALPPVDVSGILAELTQIIGLADHCTSDADKLLGRIQGEVTNFEARLRAATDDVVRFELLKEPPRSSRVGQRNHWQGIDVQDVRDRLSALRTSCDTLRESVQEGVLQTLAASLAEFTARCADDRRRSGELEFHDLLVLARTVLRDDRQGLTVRRELADRYQRLLLDEFQDTDPIQIELAVLIASDDPLAREKNWWDVELEPGRLFVVGDPKQSIYRFRRADIGMFLKARDQLIRSRKPLTTNFRTGRPIVDWVNTTFGRMIVESPGSQPEYVPLVPVRDGPPIGPPVAFFGDQHEAKFKADQLRTAEANDAAAVINRAIRERWSVGIRREGERDDWRDPKWSDIAILLPARTSLVSLERALDAAHIPYRVETSSLVYETQEVRDLMLIARAIDDPTDALRVVSALRTPGFGCGDDDLFTWRRRHGGRWDHQAPVPADAPPDHPVALGIKWMSELYEQRQWLSPSQLLERILRERRFFELGATERRPRDLWRRLRFVLDQCRAWEEAGGATFRDYLRWAEGQSGEGTRVIETVLPETDDDAVRILTVHGAKGLEFPIVILSGLTTEMKSQSSGVQVRFPPDAGWAIKLSKGVATSDFEDYQPIDEQMDGDERLRLLYVAATRARDHLVVSVHRTAATRANPTSAEVLYQNGWDPASVELLDVSDEPVADPTACNGGGALSPDQLPTLDDWRREHDAALAAAMKPVALSATRLAADEAARREAEEDARRASAGDPGLDKGPRDIDLPPWQKGRYGTAIGRAVHGALQTIDLATGDGLGAACRAQAAAEGVPGKEDIIESLCRSAVDSDIVQRAAQRRHWREVYVGIPYDEGVLEGYIDLLYEDDDGLVIVDYKTDAWRSEAELDAKVQRYAVQLQAYARAVREAVGREVVGAVLLFLGREGSVVSKEAGPTEPHVKVQ